VTLTYYPEHTGHNCEIAHIRMRRKQREQIAAKLAAGIPFDDVLDCLHLTAASASSMSNLQFISKQDLINISKEFGINKGEILHRNYSDSVAAWV